MGKVISVKGGIVWGWNIRRKSDSFLVVSESDSFFMVKPLENITNDLNYYNKFLNNRETLPVPKYHCIFNL